MKIMYYEFKKALPVWETGSELSMNRNILLLAHVGKGEYTLAVAGATSFTVSVNGKLISHGPARTAHGIFCVDEYSLGRHLTLGDNTVAIAVAGYNINCYEFINQPSFVCAELSRGGKIIAYTGEPCEGFSVYRRTDRVERVTKYSFQRAFTEVYRLDGETCSYTPEREIHVSAAGKKTFICRDVPYGEYDVLRPVAVSGGGSVTYSDKQDIYFSREICSIGANQRGYTPDELEFRSYEEVSKLGFTPAVAPSCGTDDITLRSDTYIDLDLGINHTGIFRFDIQVSGEGIVYVLFDEVMNDRKLNCFRIEGSNIIALIVKPGRYRVIGAEPYVMRYVRLVASGCDAGFADFGIAEVAYPMSGITAEFVSDDKQMRLIYDAAVETFRANAVDILMDDPSRERAGWLCDTFFTARAERVLTGKSEIEGAYLRNFLLPERFENIPEGMLPGCYPADHYDGLFIPNWAMWYGIELNEYFGRSGDRDLVDAARNRIYGLYGYFRGFENEFGLLEGLKSWVFVEWSKANELVQDVSFASNMVYASFLDAVASLYGDGEAAERAAAVRRSINALSMTQSGFYSDNALRVDGKLTVTGERTEACQYYAFFCNVATPESNPWLWNTLVNDFGYDRAEKGKFPEIYPANAFIGNYLRLDLLNRYGCRDALYDNIKGYFTHMAKKTGTLWEHTGDYASCNHGFASHVVYWMKALGMVRND